MSIRTARRRRRRRKAPATNRIGLGIDPYRGLKTTLCAGCSHNSISERTCKSTATEFAARRVPYAIR